MRKQSVKLEGVPDVAVQRAVGLLRAIHKCRTLGPEPLAVHREGGRVSYNPDADTGWLEYQHARWEVQRWPKINWLLERLRLI